MIKHVIEQEYGEKAKVANAWSVIEFTPWSCADVAALTDEFYVAIAAAMPNDEKGKRAKSLLTMMAPLAAAVGKSAVTSLVDKYLGKGAWSDMADAATDSLADEAAKLKFEQPSFVQRFNATAKAINQAGRNVLVMIDDIDRLHSDELLGVMKAVRLLGRFNRVHYLLSYDEETVLDVLTGTDLASGHRSRARLYLEKIVQYPIALPPIQLVSLEKKLRAQLSAVADRYALPIKRSVDTSERNLDPILFSQGGLDPIIFSEGDLDRIISATPDFGRLTLRSIYRWCNQLDMLLTLVGPRDVDFVDAALITYLRLWHNEVYLKLPSWRIDLIEEYGDTTFLPNEEWVAKVSEVLDKRTDASEVARGIVNLLATLFPRVRPGVKERSGCAVSKREYFSRYFAFALPAGDVRDLDVRGELENLAHEGSWGPDGVIAGSLLDPRTSFLVGSKAWRAIDVIQNAPSASCAEAAHKLMRLILESGRIDTVWGQVLYALLGRAVSAADSAVTARAVVDGFVADFGVVDTTDILERRLALPMVDDDAMLAASAGIRAEVFTLCVRDLTTDVSDADLAAPTILRVLRYLDDDLWRLLRAKAEDLLRAGKTDLADLAARFVMVRANALGDTGDYKFFATEFGQLVPEESWSGYEVGNYEDDDFRFNDTSLRNRAIYASVAIRKAVENAKEA
jgi:hypothetical protein